MLIIYDTKKDDFSLEFWAASTKHPDSIFYFSKYVEKFAEPFKHFDVVNFYGFVLDSISRLWFPTMELEQVERATNIVKEWREYRHKLPLDDDGIDFKQWLIKNYIDGKKEGYTSTYNGRYVW